MPDITSNLVIYYDFNNLNFGGGTLADGSGNGHTGTIHGSPTLVSGPNGFGAVSFSPNAYIDTNTAWAHTNAVTVAWWNYATVTDDKVQFGIDVTPFGTPKRLIAWVPHTDGNVYWDYGAWNGNGRLSGTYGSGNLNVWTHVALVSNGAGGNFAGIYINGSLAYSHNVSDGSSLTQTILIGAGCSTDFGCPWAYTTGKQAEWRIYNRALTSGDVSALYALTYVAPYKAANNFLSFF